MSEKSGRQLFSVFSKKKPLRDASKSVTTVEQRCAAGLHAVDPLWTKCWYCEAAGKQASSTQVEPAAGPDSGRGRTVSSPAEFAAARDRETLLEKDSETPLMMDGRGRTVASEPAQPAGPGGRGRTVASAPASPSRGHTMVGNAPEDAAPSIHAAAGGKRLVGVLTTFTWSRLGQLYEVRDGRNFVGSGETAGNTEVLDVVIAGDRLLSGSHFMILCQGTKIIINDNFSTNGTFVDGVQIDTRGMELPDDAVIKAGATVFRFQRIHTISE